MSGAKAVLLVSPEFPPSRLAGAHRARLLAQRLPDHGWRPIVIRVDERFYQPPLDGELAGLMRPRPEEIRVGALPPLPGLSDLGIRAFAQFGRAIDEAVARHAPRVVFFTGFPFYQMLHAGRVRRRHRLPVVLDFQDPWVSAYGASRPPLSKEGLVHRLAARLEPAMVRQASFITSVSQVQNQEMAARYPWLDARRMEAIPIGGEPADFDSVGAARRADGERPFEFRSIGAYWPKAEPTVRRLFKALALLRERDPGRAAGVRLSFTGADSSGQGARPISELARQEGVADMIEEHPQRAPFVEALRLMTTADALILYGSDEPHYTASKVYPVLMAGRPYLSLFHRRSSAHALLTAADAGVALGFEDQAELAALTPQIAQALGDLAAGRRSFAPADPQVYAPFTAHAVAGRFAAIFERVAAEAGTL
jgi:hypothetical protein